METDVGTAFERADAVFEGRVLDVQAGADPSTPTHVTLEVVQQWKGVDRERVELETPASSASCGVAFEVGTSWLVYAERVDGALHAGLCSRTKRIEEAQEDLAELGAGVVPVDVGDTDGVEARQTEPPARGGCASCSVTSKTAGLPTGGLVMAALMLGVWMRPRRR